MIVYQAPYVNSSSNTIPHFAAHAHAHAPRPRPRVVVPVGNQRNQSQVQPQAQSAEGEKAVGQSYSDHPLNVVPSQQQITSLEHNPVPEKTSIPGLGQLQTDALSVAHHHHPQTFPSRMESEPPQPNSPAIDALREERLGGQQGPSARGQSAPLQLDDPFIQAPEYPPQTSAGEQQTGNRRNSGCTNQ
ncbi:hypothetical protein BDV12DRAFT_165763 [Aspergillus spectabilis]